jgi:hypothetical protein
MTVTLCGVVTDKLGQSEQISTRMVGNVAVETRFYEAISSLEYRSTQPRAEVNVEHRGQSVGEVVHYERNLDDAIIAVAVVRGHDELLAPRHPPVYWSVELRMLHGGRRDVQITGLAIVERPATVGLSPLTVIGGDVREVGTQVRWHNRTPHRALLERAAEAHRHRRPGGGLTIEDPTQTARQTRLDGGLLIDGRGNPVPDATRGGRYIRTDDGQILPLEIRPGGPILSVR